MDDDVGVEFLEGVEEELGLEGNVNFAEEDGFSGESLPTLDSFFYGFDGGDTGIAVLFVDFASGEVVNNHDVPAEVGHSEGEGPSNETISAGNDNPFLHKLI